MKKMNFRKNFQKSFKSGFTLIELMVVVGIIALLASVVLAALNTARKKGADAAVKSNLRNAIGQGEILYTTRTANLNTYINACTNGPVDGSQGVGSLVNAAAKAAGVPIVVDPNYYSTNPLSPGGAFTKATCNVDGAGTAWAAEAPLQSVGANQMWCVDSTGKSKQESVFLANGIVTCF